MRPCQHACRNAVVGAGTRCRGCSAPGACERPGSIHPIMPRHPTAKLRIRHAANGSGAAPASHDPHADITLLGRVSAARCDRFGGGELGRALDALPDLGERTVDRPHDGVAVPRGPFRVLGALHVRVMAAGGEPDNLLATELKVREDRRDHARRQRRIVRAEHHRRAMHPFRRRRGRAGKREREFRVGSERAALLLRNHPIALGPHEVACRPGRLDGRARDSGVEERERRQRPQHQGEGVIARAPARVE